MLLKKRPRPPMRRTTSMTEFTAEEDAPRPSDQAGTDNRSLHLQLLQQQGNQRRVAEVAPASAQWRGSGGPAGADLLENRHYAEGLAPPGGGGGARRRYSGHFAAVEVAPFLMACGLCKRCLGPGRDTFMYRGDIAFCSLECRQQHMNQDERKEKCSLTSMKDTPPVTNGSEKSDSAETVAAA